MVKRVVRVFVGINAIRHSLSALCISPPSLQSNHRVSEIPMPPESLNIKSAPWSPPMNDWRYRPQSEVPKTTHNEDKQGRTT